MKIEHNGTLMRIYVSQSHHREGRGVHQLIVAALAEAQIAEATAFLGIEGFGSHHYISNATAVDSYVDLPILIEAVDEDDEKIRNFIPKLESILEDGLVTLERLQTIFYRAGGTEN
jgi:PII-like signaling protein